MPRAVDEVGVGTGERSAERRSRLACLGDCALWTLFVGFIALPIVCVLRPELALGIVLVLFYLFLLPGALLADLLGH